MPTRRPYNEQIIATCFLHPFGAPVRFGNAALAEDEPEDLRLATNAYLRCEYGEAVGLLGGIAPQEFNDAIFHYYMANCMVHMHEKGSAIGE